jgi:hypothetical protein
MFLDFERVHLVYSCLKHFIGSDDEDTRRSGAGGRGSLQVRLKEIISNLESKDTLTVAVTSINQTLVVHNYVIFVILS